MRTTYLFLVILSLFCFSCSDVQAQIKVEKESRIRKKDVPQKALVFIDSLGLKKCIRWYREESQDGISIEAKTKYKKNRHSIEFDSLGVIQDLEIELDEQELDTVVLQNLQNYLKFTFDDYKIQKIQSQYIDSETNLLDFLLRKKQPVSLKTCYEIVVEVQTTTGFELLEILTDDTGKVLNTYQIDIRNTDNLEY